MTLSVNHEFVSPKINGPDATKVGPDAWNSDLVFSGGGEGALAVRSIADPNGAEWLIPGSIGSFLVSAGATARPVWTTTLPSELLVGPLPAISGALLTALPSHTHAPSDITGIGVITTDPRLSDARTPIAHTQAWSTITSTPTTLGGYGIIDAAALVHTHAPSDITGTAVVTADVRLSDARTPVAHDQAWSTITGTPTTLGGYGITDGVATSDSRLSDARTPVAHNQAWSTITSTPTTLAGYGIIDGGAVYTNLVQPSANVLEVVNGAASQTFSIYRTATEKITLSFTGSEGGTFWFDAGSQWLAFKAGGNNIGTMYDGGLYFQSNKYVSVSGVNGHFLGSSISLVKWSDSSDGGPNSNFDTAIGRGGVGLAVFSSPSAIGNYSSYAANPKGTWRAGDPGSRPAADVALRGTYWHLFSATGVTDEISVCAKDAADVYTWRAFVGTTDSRLSDARTPTTHTHTFASLTSVPTTLAGYGIIDTNMPTAAALQTARSINGTSFDGTADITVTAAAGTLTGTTLNATVVSSSLTSIGTLTALSTHNGGVKIGGGVFGAGVLYKSASLGLAVGTIAGSSYDFILLNPSGASTILSVPTGTLNVSLTGITSSPTFTASSLLSISNTLNLVTTSTDGVLASNNTAATAGVPVQISPRLRFHAHVWNTTTPADNVDDWWIESVPTSGATPSGTLRFGKSINNGAVTYPLSLLSNGNISVLTHVIVNSSGTIWFGGGSFGRLSSPADAQINVTNSALTAGVGLDVATDGIVKVRTRAQTGNAALWSGADAIAVTSTDGHVLANDTLSVVGVPVQISPRLRFRGHVWNTTTPADNTDDWWIETIPGSGATPSSVLKIVSSLNGAGGNNALVVNNFGSLTMTGNIQSGATANFGWTNRSWMSSPANGQANFANQAISAGIGFDFSTDSLLKIRTRAQTGNAALWSGADGIAVTSTDGHVLANDTASTSGVAVQQSPRLRFRSHVWNTTVTAADNTDDWWIESVPASGTLPSSTLKFVSSRNGGTAATVFSLIAQSTANYFFALPSTGLLQWSSRGVLAAPADAQFNFQNNAGTAGAGFDTATDSILKIRTRAQTGNAALWAGADGIALTSTDGIVLVNATSATAGVTRQLSPRLRLVGSAWNTTSVAADSVAWTIDVLPVTGTTTSSVLQFGAGSTVVSITAAGTLTATVGLICGTTGTHSWNASTIMAAPANGQINFANNANSAGVGFDLLTDAVLKVRTRAQSAYATVDALGYSVSGVAGASKAAGPVVSITVVNGIVTACS